LGDGSDIGMSGGYDRSIEAGWLCRHICSVPGSSGDRT
jgi:hypothetical protein